MSYGRVGVVLGVQAGLGAIINFCEGVKKGIIKNVGRVPPGSTNVRNRLTEAEIYSVLNQVMHIEKNLKREQVSVSWSCLGSSPRIEMPLLAKVLGLNIEAADILSFDEVEQNDFDAVIYVPLDVQQPRQVEQLARLAMILPRVRHVALASAPRWHHAQLVALKENWLWLDPRDNYAVNTWTDEMIRFNGGLTKKDLAKITLPVVRPEFVEAPIVSRSPIMKEVLTLVDAVADSDSTVLISGSSGTGKELIAQRIHLRSHRRRAPMIAVNCGAIPEELLESELFGHVRGAFTGAISNREGRFEAAEGGTLFLDEIGEMGPNLQVKLLRVLQSRQYEPVGSTKSKASNVRIVTATNKDLEEEVRVGNFREDLFYRLNVIPVQLPSLRERKEDIQNLVEHFIRKFNLEKSRRVTGVTRASLRSLVAYDWPGNVRELENLVERMVILKSSGMIDVLDFPEKYRRVSLSEIEYEDLMSIQKSGTSQQQQMNLTSQVANRSLEEQELGGEGTMKLNGTFTKGTIDQSTPTETGIATAPVTGETSIQHGAGAESAAYAEIHSGGSDASMSVEQAIRLISDKMAFPHEGLDFNSVVDQFENILILQALERTGWNRNRAAQLLRLNRTTLVEKLKKKQLMPPMRYADDSVLEGNA